VQSPPYSTGIASLGQRGPDPGLHGVGHGDQRSLVDQARRCTAFRPACGDVEVAAVVDVVPGERLGDACLAQYR
jgi:hypothetical protein